MFTEKLIKKLCAAFLLTAVPFAAVSRVYGQQAPAGASVPADLPSGLRDVHSAGNWNLDLNYPGGGIRYFPADGRALEILAQAQDRVFTGVLRYYNYPSSLASGPVSPYIAVEGDYLSFKGKYSKGSGFGGGVYGGVEYFPWRSVSFQTELGAMYVSVKDKDTSISQGGLEFVLNFGINLYFGGKRP